MELAADATPFLPHGSGPVGRSGQLTGCGGEVEVLCCQSSGVVRDQCQAHLVVADVDVGMVAGLLSQLANLVHEGEGGDEVLERESPYEFAGLNRPAGDSGKAVGNFSRRE